MDDLYDNFEIGKFFASVDPEVFGELCIKGLKNCSSNALLEITRIVSTKNSFTPSQKLKILTEIISECLTFLRNPVSESSTSTVFCDCLISACQMVITVEGSNLYESTFKVLIQIIEEKLSLIQDSQEPFCIITVILNLLKALLVLARSCKGNKDIAKDFHCFILEVLQNGNPSFVSFIMVHIMPATTDETLHRKAWNVANELLIHRETDSILSEPMLSAFIITCSMCDICFVPNPPFLLETEATFWKLIQTGLTSHIGSLRKRSMYALKKAVDHCTNSNKNVNCQLNGETIFFWDNKFHNKLITLWEMILLLFEVLEEKQIHVLKPAMIKMDKLIEVVTSPEDVHSWCSSWLFCVYTRMLTHESKFVIRWAISSVLKLRFQNIKHNSNFITEFLIGTFLTSLNDASIFQKTESGPTHLLIPTGDILAALLSDIIEKLECGDDFVVKFVHQLSQGVDAWGGVSLFHVTYALTLLPSRKCLSSYSLKELRKMICNSLRSQESFLRGAIQCNILTFVWRLVDPCSVTLDDVSHLFAVLRRSKCLQRGTTQWMQTIEWLQQLFTDCKTVVHAYCTVALRALLHMGESNNTFENEQASPLECQRISYMFVLLDDAGLVDGEVWGELFGLPVEWLLGSHCRPYLSESKVHNVLDLCLEILKEEQICEGSPGNTLTHIVQGLISPGTSNLIQWLAQRAHNSVDVQQITQYTNALRIFLSNNFLPSSLIPFVNSTLPQCQQLLKKENEFQIPDTLNAWHMLALLWELLEIDQNSTLKDTLTSSTLEVISSGGLEDLIQKPKSICGKPVEKLLSASAMKAAWYCLSCSLIQPCALVSAEEGNILARLAMDSLQTASHSAAVNIFKGLQELLKIVTDRSLVGDLVHLGWQTCMEMRHSDLFIPAVAAFIKAFFQPPLMSSHTRLLTNKVNELCNLGETCTGVFPVLVQHCLQVWTKKENFSTALDFVSTICNYLTIGTVHRKDQRMLNDTYSYIMTLGDKLTVNQLVEIDVNPDVACRALCVAFLCGLSPDCDDHRMLASLLAEHLVEKDKEFSTTHGRHFANSLIHRVKNRCWQGLLILVPLLNKEKCIWLLEKAYVSMTEEGQQPSVRSLQEWLAVRILLQYPELQENLMAEMEKYANYRLGCVGSFLSMVVLLTSCTKSLPLEREESLLASWLRGIFPWCMAQHFNTRLFARTAWLRVYKRVDELEFRSVLSEFQVVHQCLKSQKEYGNPSKNVKMLVENFYYTCFKADANYTIQTIFYDLLRLLHTSQDEWIEPSLFIKCLQRLGIREPLLLPVLNEEFSLDTISTPNCVPAATDILEEEGDGSHFQKKITPWTQMEFSPNCNVPERSPRKRMGGLVVVASLIDKTPNLGGLCRTCEIFGASEYVIGSLKYVQDKQFQSLSVTAEKWISIKEVHPNMLKPYLLEMKSQGFVLVGVEQTTLSKDLTKFTFPKDTVLLLGNEREGLPVDLIQLLDVCVEIPQLGVVRSLNVHVSGALLIWEYTRQHLTNNPAIKQGNNS